MGGHRTYGCVNMNDFLEALTQKLEPNPTSLKNFRRMYTAPRPHKVDSKAPLETAVLYDRVQARFGTTAPCMMAENLFCPICVWTPRRPWRPQSCLTKCR